jgi:hypothetical protein
MTRTIQRAGLAVASIVVFTFMAVVPANAQYKPTGSDGITASPKLRAQLDERAVKAAPVLATTTSMPCPKCTDIWVARADTDSKGLGARTMMGTSRRVAQHLCEGCSTEWASKGSGKGKQAVASHKCNGCGAENLACCSKMGASGVATKGMEQKFEIAPLK